MWTRSDFRSIIDPPAIGMIHLWPLPGAPRWGSDLVAVEAAALADAEALVEGGLRAIMVENYHDIPFFPGRVPPETVAAMSVVIAAVRRRFPDLRLGVNVLRNDALAALAIAAACSADFIRVNVHTGAAVTDQGTIEGSACVTLRRRKELGAENVAILADVRVKHARPLVVRSLADEALDLRLRGMADAIIVTGEATGSSACREDVAQVREALPDCPLLVGSGVNVDNAAAFLSHADGCIIGSSLQKIDRATGLARISRSRTAAFRDVLADISAKG